MTPALARVNGLVFKFKIWDGNLDLTKLIGQPLTLTYDAGLHAVKAKYSTIAVAHMFTTLRHKWSQLLMIKRFKLQSISFSFIRLTNLKHQFRLDK